MNKTWFSVNKYWGLYPTTIEAWLIILAMVIALTLVVVTSSFSSTSLGETLTKAFPLSSLSVSLTILISLLTSTKPLLGKTNSQSKDYSPDKPEAYLFLAVLVVPVICYYLVFSRYFGSIILTIVLIVLLLVYRFLKTLT